jgi:hypothetical protein
MSQVGEGEETRYVQRRVSRGKGERGFVGMRVTGRDDGLWMAEGYLISGRVFTVGLGHGNRLPDGGLRPILTAAGQVIETPTRSDVSIGRHHVLLP